MAFSCLPFTEVKIIESGKTDRYSLIETKFRHCLSLVLIKRRIKMKGKLEALCRTRCSHLTILLKGLCWQKTNACFKMVRWDRDNSWALAQSICSQGERPHRHCRSLPLKGLHWQYYQKWPVARPGKGFAKTEGGHPDCTKNCALLWVQY